MTWRGLWCEMCCAVLCAFLCCAVLCVFVLLCCVFAVIAVAVGCFCY